MKIERYRSSFTAFFIASDEMSLGSEAEALEQAGYQVVRFNEVTGAFSEFVSNPPHFVVFHSEENGFSLGQVIQSVRQQLPESHIFLFTPVESRDQTEMWLDRGVYEIVYLPLVSKREFVHAVDRAAERDFFMYALEQNPGGLDWYHQLMRLMKSESADDVIRIFCESLSKELRGAPIVYFRYLGNRRVLVATFASGTTNSSIRDLGIDFNLQMNDFRSAQLRQPNSLSVLADMVKTTFEDSSFEFRTVEVLGEVKGLMLVLGQSFEIESNEHINDGFVALERALAFLDFEKRLHSASVKDLTTDLLNRPHFIERATQELSRARRLEAPMSLALISIDQYNQILDLVGLDEAQTVLKMVARIFEKHSRVNDIIGRTGMDEFGLLLPHTPRDGALIKSERLRRIIETADFSKVVSKFPKITISLGVSEYPSMSHDVDELISSADEALFEVRKIGNKTCLAHVPDNFEPDFVIPSEAN